MLLGSTLLVLVACQTQGGADARVETAADTDTDTDTDADTDTPAIVVVSAVSPALADTWGGGGRLSITVDHAVGATGASLGAVPLLDFSVDDDTHVSGVPGAHPAGVVDVVVDNAIGPSTTGAGLFEYWTPAQIGEVDLYLDADKGFSAGAWLDQGPNARELTQADAAHQPTLAGGTYGSMPAVHFTPQQYLRLPAPVEMLDGSSIFAVASWTATTDVTPPPGNVGNVPLTIVGDGVSGYGAFGAAGGQIESNHYVGGPVPVRGGTDLNDGVVRLIGATYETTTVTRVYVGNEQQGVDSISAPMIGLNTYDTVGAGYPGTDGWDGDIGAVVVISGVIDVDDRTKLDLWSQQRFGTPVSALLDSWTREEVSALPDEWHPRDGAQMVQLASGRVLMVGGWSHYDPWGTDDGVGDRTTNEVWASDDLGLTWFVLLDHDPYAPKEGPGARFPPGHTVSLTHHDDHAVLIGSDCLSPPLLGEVWVENDDGATWTLVSTDAPTDGRCLHMVANLDDDLYVMGGQVNLYDESTAIADVWRSTDGGVTWTELDAPPWVGRGMVYRPAEVDGQLVIVGGGRYDETLCVAYNGVYSFDGTSWTTVLADGHSQFQASYYNALATLEGRLWLLNGYTGTEDLSRAIYSDDGGTTWAEFPGGSGGVASHADAVVALPDRVLRVSGSLGERVVWGLFP